MPTFTESDQPDGNIDIDTFAPTGLDVDQWLDAVVSADMNYAILTTKHHDGFVLWPTAYAVPTFDPYSIAETTWYANNGSPDVVGLFVAKCRTRNLNPCLYYSIWDKTYELRVGSALVTAAYRNMVKTQLTELLTNYGDIGAIWLDGWGWKFAYDEIAYEEIYAHIKTLQPNCIVIENSHEHPVIHSQIEIYETPTADGSIPDGNTRPAEEVDTIRTDGKWFYHAGADQTSTALRSLAYLQAATANANENTGTFLLGIMPGTNGQLPSAQVTRLGQLGA